MKRKKANAAPKETLSTPKTTQSSYEQAVEVRDRIKKRLDSCAAEDLPKFNDAWTRAANVVRQYEKERAQEQERRERNQQRDRRSLDSVKDEDIAEYLKSLPELRLDAILCIVRPEVLANKPLFP